MNLEPTPAVALDRNNLPLLDGDVVEVDGEPHTVIGGNRVEVVVTTPAGVQTTHPSSAVVFCLGETFVVRMPVAVADWLDDNRDLVIDQLGGSELIARIEDAVRPARGRPFNIELSRGAAERLAMHVTRIVTRSGFGFVDESSPALTGAANRVLAQVGGPVAR